jgi:hypothetical protein
MESSALSKIEDADREETKSTRLKKDVDSGEEEELPQEKADRSVALQEAQEGNENI